MPTVSCQGKVPSTGERPMMKWVSPQLCDHMAHGLQLGGVDDERRVGVGQVVDGHVRRVRGGQAMLPLSG